MGPKEAHSCLHNALRLKRGHTRGTTCLGFRGNSGAGEGYSILYSRLVWAFIMVQFSEYMVLSVMHEYIYTY